MNKFIKMPLWIFELMTSAKSFKDNPVIGSPILNRVGLHVIRMLVSHAIMKARMWFLSFNLSAKDKKFYFQNGYIIKENFLPDEEFALLGKEVKSFQGQFREARQGDTLTHRAVLSPDVLEDYPALLKMISNNKFKRLVQFTAGHLRLPLLYLENVKNKYSKGLTDPQKTLHNDTFHPSMKFWFFFDDVAKNAGPFVYVPGSHKLNWKRIKWQYQMSLNAKENGNNLHARGSTRFDPKDLEALGLPGPHAFAVKKNTLVIVNVFGIHRRGDSDEKSTRLALWGDSRTNPFLPFPGIGGETANFFQYYFLEAYRKRIDEDALKRGVPSPWRVLGPDEK